MKSMRNGSRGVGLQGAFEYNSKIFLIGGNVAGNEAKNLAQEFGRVRSLRPDIGKPVWHQSLRLPKGESISVEAWLKVADQYMARIGFSEAHPRAVFFEDDPEGQHIHIVASRVSVDGAGLLLKRSEV